MGLAASQARLLSITSRLSDNELRAQLINNQKIRLATESSNASDTYVAALNNAKMMFANYDKDNNKSYQDLTFNALTAFNPYNNQYGLANQNGNILVSELDAHNYQRSSDLTSFLETYGLKYETSFFDKNTLGKHVDDQNRPYLTTIVEADGTKTDVYSPYTIDELKEMYLGSEGGKPHVGYSNIPQDPTFIAYSNALDNATLKSDKVIDVASPAVHAWLKQLEAGKTGKVSLENIVGKLSKVTQDSEIQPLMDDLAALFDVIKNMLGGNEISNKYFDEFIKGVQSWKVNSTDTNEPITLGGDLTDTDISNNILYIGADGAEEGETFYGVTYDASGYINGVYNYSYDAAGNIVQGDALATTSWQEYTEDTDDGPITCASKSSFDWVYASDGNKIGFTYTVHEASEKDSASNWLEDYSTTETYNNLVWADVEKLNSVSVTRTEETNNPEHATKVVKALVQNFWQTYSNYVNYYNLLGNGVNGDYDGTNVAGTVFEPAEFKDAALEYEIAMEAFYDSVNGWEVTNPDGTTSWEPGLAGVIWGVNPSGNGNVVTIPSEELLNIFDFDWILNHQTSEIEPDFQSVIDFHALEDVFNVYGEPIYAWVDKTDPTGNQDAYSKAQWYTNLYNRMQQGYTTLQDGLASSKEWIRFALESGLVVMEQVDSALTWKSFEYGACSDITEQTDTEAVTIAEAEYNRTMNKIKAKDQRYDLELKNIDTEHTSLQTEYESIKSVIEKNIGRTFKIYS